MLSKLKTRPDGSKYRTKTKIVYFEGTPYEIDEEVEAHSDSTASLDTSDDDFAVDDDDVLLRMGQVLERQLAERPDLRKHESSHLQQSLRKNVAKKRSLFGRKQIYMCASFNGWIPVELKSLHELKLEREKGAGLKDYIRKCKK